MSSNSEKPEVIETEENWQFNYPGFAQVVPKDVVKTKKEASELADNSYADFKKRQSHEQPLES